MKIKVCDLHFYLVSSYIPLLKVNPGQVLLVSQTERGTCRKSRAARHTRATLSSVNRLLKLWTIRSLTGLSAMLAALGSLPAGMVSCVLHSLLLSLSLSLSVSLSLSLSLPCSNISQSNQFKY